MEPAAGCFSEEQFREVCAELQQPDLAGADWELLVETSGIRIHRLLDQVAGRGRRARGQVPAGRGSDGRRRGASQSLRPFRPCSVGRPSELSLGAARREVVCPKSVTQLKRGSADSWAPARGSPLPGDEGWRRGGVL